MMAAFMTGREIPMSCGSGDGVLKWQKRGWENGLVCLYALLRGRQPVHRLHHRRGPSAPGAPERDRGQTRARPPVSLAYTEEVPDRSTAQRKEAAIKKLPRKRKLALIEGGTP